MQSEEGGIRLGLQRGRAVKKDIAKARYISHPSTLLLRLIISEHRRTPIDDDAILKGAVWTYDQDTMLGFWGLMVCTDTPSDTHAKILLFPIDTSLLWRARHECNDLFDLTIC